MPSHLVAFEVVIRVAPHSNLLHHLKPLVVLRVCHITIHLHTDIKPLPPADNNTVNHGRYRSTQPAMQHPYNRIHRDSIKQQFWCLARGSKGTCFC